MKTKKQLSLAIKQSNDNVNTLTPLETIVSNHQIQINNYQANTQKSTQSKVDNKTNSQNNNEIRNAKDSFIDALDELDKLFRESSKSNIMENEGSSLDYTGGSSNISHDFDMKRFPQLFTPQEVKSYLDKYVVGQEHAKKVLSVAAFNHQRRANGLNTKKSNILLVGPSGSGKTYLIEKLSEILCVPIAYADATTLTQAGYVGEDVDSVLANLYYKANNDIDLAEVGIVFIDEFDKIQRHKSNSSNLDVGGVGVQQALLKMLEGTEMDIKLDAQKSKIVRMNTKNILFICAGAFVGIEKIIKSRVQPNKRRIGFTDENFSATEELNDFNKLLPKVNSDDIINFGFIPEIMGRIPLVAGLEKLGEEDLINILTNTQDNLIDEFKTNFSYSDRNYQLYFTKQSIIEIARLAIKREVGARGLRSIFDNLLLDTMFDVPSFNHSSEQNKVYSILVTKENVIKNTKLHYLNTVVEDEEILDESKPKFKNFLNNHSLEILNSKLIKEKSNKSKPKAKSKSKAKQTSNKTKTLAKTNSKANK